ncbi:hypothetical protein QEM13_002046 [Pseudomonas putida]|nr:hypothetical protein [Pseudomonas putida]
MTVSTTDSVVEYVSGGPAFPIPYRFLQNSDIEAVLVHQDGTSKTLVLGTQYTLTGAGSQSGGTLTSTYAASVLATPGATLSISRVMTATQPTDLRNQGRYFAETHENVFDRLTMLIQQGFAWTRRALLRPIGKDYYDAEGRRITSVADPVENQDAATKKWATDFIADILATGQGPINNAANVIFVGANGQVGTVQDLGTAVGAAMIGESRWGLTLQDVVNLQPHYLSAYGFPHGGDDLAALQSLLNQIAADGGGRLIYDIDEDVPVSNGVFIPSNISLEFTGKGFLKLTAMTTQGALLTVFTGDRSDPPVNNVRIINPRLDCGGFGWPTDDDFGNNGIAGTNCYDVEVWGGIIKNAKHGKTSLYSTGGTGCNFETGCRNVLVDGLAILNCSSALGTAAAANAAPPLDFRTSTGIQFRNIRAFDCGVIFQAHQATNPPFETVDIIAGSIRGVDAYNCGRGQQPGTETDYGALIFDRASNWDIGDINIFNTTAYGSVPAIIRFIRSTKMKFSNINLFGNCDVMVSHVRPNVVPQFNYSGALRDNVFEVTCHGSVIDAVKAVAVDVAGTWRECKYHLRMYSLSGLLINMDASAPGATNIALFELGVEGKTVSGNLPQIRTLSNTFPSGQFTRIGPQRFNTLTLNSAAGSDSIVADGSLNLAASGVVKVTITSGGYVTLVLPVYATNAAAVTGGVPLNGVYQTATGELRIRV